MKDYAKTFYKSAAWKKCRAAYLKRVGGLCERCLKVGRITPAVIVHHKIYIAPENINNLRITLDPENLEALCMECHNREHFGDGKRYVVDDLGRVTALE